MFKICALSCVAGLTMLTAASAADLPYRAQPPVFTQAPVFSWTGVYAGFNAGYAFSDKQTARTSPIDSLDVFTLADIKTVKGESVGFKQEGFTGGAQIGYNYQFAPGAGIVVGFEADAQYTDLARTRKSGGRQSVIEDFGFGSLDVGLANSSRQSLEFLGTVRGRLGYAFDRVLVYGTGGFAYGMTDFRSTTTAEFSGNGFFTPGGGYGVPAGVFSKTSAKFNDMQTGYVYGGGIEYALPTDSFLNFFRSSAVTIKAEFLHYDLGTRTVVGFNDNVPAISGIAPVATTVTRIKTEGNIVRAGVNYKFGSY